MWGNGKKKRKMPTIDTLVGQHTELRGDIVFSGGLHVDGVVKGNVSGTSDATSILVMSETGRIEGEVTVPNVILNGTVIGDVHAIENIELAAHAQVTGNVYYNLIEMAMGAEVNGNLVHLSDTAKLLPKLEPDKAPAAKHRFQESIDS